MMRCFENQLSRSRIFGNQIEVGSAGGNDEWLVQLASNHAGGYTVGIVVVGIDQVEIESVANQFPDRR